MSDPLLRQPGTGRPGVYKGNTQFLDGVFKGGAVGRSCPKCNQHKPTEGSRKWGMCCADCVAKATKR